MNNHFNRSFFSIRKQFVICRKGAKEHTARIFFFGDDHCVTRFNFFENYSTD